MTVALGVSTVHGRGVFAERAFRAGELIERAPVVVIPRAELEHLDRTRLYDYYFAWGDDGEDAAFALGLGSFYNHAELPNADYLARPEALAIDFVALRDIAAGEEVTIHYLGDPGSADPPWFLRDARR